MISERHASRLIPIEDAIHQITRRWPKSHKPIFVLASCSSWIVSLIGNLLRAILQAEPFDRPLQNENTFVELIDRHKLTCAMRNANVAGAEDHSLGAERNQA